MRAITVSRRRLVDRLEEDLFQDESFGSKLTLVSALAGYGNTTLVVEWLSHRQTPVGWVSLDVADNDLTPYPWSGSTRATSV